MYEPIELVATRQPKRNIFTGICFVSMILIMHWLTELYKISLVIFAVYLLFSEQTFF